MFISLSQYAAIHNKSADTIRRMAENGALKTAKKIGRNWAVDGKEAYPVKKRANRSPINVLSLFSGCGGLDLGFEGGFRIIKQAVNGKIHPDWRCAPDTEPGWKRLPKTRFRTIFANDIRPDAKTAWCAYFGKRGIHASVYRLGSIVDLTRAHKAGQPVFPQNIDVVTGGFPCQDFSIAGKRQGLQSQKSHDGGCLQHDAPSIESRGQLYMWMREVIAITQPKVFIAENVKGLANLAGVKSIIENDFRSIGRSGYLVVEARVLHAADYGVPQSRERVVFIGFKKSSLNRTARKQLSRPDIHPDYDPYPPQTHSYTQNGDHLLPPTCVAQALAGLSEPDKSTDKSQQKYSKAKYMGKHCQGQTEVSLCDLAPTIRSEHHGNIEYRRLSQEHGGKHTAELDSGLKERRLTVRECARLQTFPDDYEFIIPAKDDIKGVSASEAYKLIGNAVPPLLGYHIAKRLEKNWELYFGGATQ